MTPFTAQPYGVCWCERLYVSFQLTFDLNDKAELQFQESNAILLSFQLHRTLGEN